MPGELGDAVLAVTGKTRLWNRERIDVARELCAHFLDGVESGADRADLLSAFGDARTAARLITRAKKRNRPWAWRAMKRTVQGVCLLFALSVGWYGWNAARFYSGSPTIGFNFQAEMNAPYVSLPVGDRGWPLYRDAQRALIKAKFRDTVEKIETWPYVKPGTEQWRQACTLVDRHGEAVSLIRRGAAKARSAYIISEIDNSAVDFQKNPEMAVPEGVGTDPEENPVSIGVLLPQLAVYRSHARLMSFVAHRAAEEGRSEDAVSAVETVLRVSRHASEDGTLIAQLVSVAVSHLAFDVLNTIVRDHPSLLSDAQLTRLAHVVGAHAPGTGGGDRGWLPDLRFERRGFDDILQRFYTDDGSGDGRLCRTPESYADDFGIPVPKGASLFKPVLAGVVAGRKDTREMYNRLMDLMESEVAKPLYQRDTGLLNREVDALVGDGSIRYSLVAVMVPSLSRAAHSFEITRTLRDATAAGLAVELFRRKNGAYPMTWDELVPSLLPSAPVDPWSGRALCMKAGAGAGGRPLIYSVGADKTDSGGTIGTPWDVVSAWSSATVQGRGGQIATGDWVIWPKVEAEGERPQVGPNPPPGTPPPNSTRKKPAYQWGWIGSLSGS